MTNTAGTAVQLAGGTLDVPYVQAKREAEAEAFAADLRTPLRASESDELLNDAIERAIAANSGSYTMPLADIAYPFGLGGTGCGDDDLRPVLG